MICARPSLAALFSYRVEDPRPIEDNDFRIIKPHCSQATVQSGRPDIKVLWDGDRLIGRSVRIQLQQVTSFIPAKENSSLIETSKSGEEIVWGERWSHFTQHCQGHILANGMERSLRIGFIDLDGSNAEALHMRMLSTLHETKECGAPHPRRCRLSRNSKLINCHTGFE